MTLVIRKTAASLFSSKIGLIPIFSSQYKDILASLGYEVEEAFNENFKIIETQLGLKATEEDLQSAKKELNNKIEKTKEELNDKIDKTKEELDEKIDTHASDQYSHIKIIHIRELETAVVPGYYIVTSDVVAMYKPYYPYQLMFVSRLNDGMQWKVNQYLFYNTLNKWEYRSGTYTTDQSQPQNWTEWEEVQTILNGVNDTAVKIQSVLGIELNGLNGKATLSGTTGVDISSTGGDINITTNKAQGKQLLYNGEPIAIKSDMPNVVQQLGSSESDVMSQKAVTDTLFADGRSASMIQIGRNAKASGNNAPIAIGLDSVSSGGSSIAIGDDSEATANGSISIGTSTASGVNSIALGDLSTSKASNSVALGYNSQVNESDVNCVSVGAYAEGGRKRIINVADGVQDSDAATYKQAKAAQTAADNAQSSADKAQLAADKAQSSADTADDKAEKAQETANKAVEASDNNKKSITTIETWKDGVILQETGENENKVISQKTVTNELAKKQPLLKSGENISTINGYSLLNGGNLELKTAESPIYIEKEEFTVNEDLQYTLSTTQDVRGVMLVVGLHLPLYKDDYSFDLSSKTFTVTNAKIPVTPGKNRFFIIYLVSNLPTVKSQELTADENGKITLPIPDGETYKEIYFVVCGHAFLYSNQYALDKANNSITILDPEETPFIPGEDKFLIMYSY